MSIIVSRVSVWEVKTPRYAWNGGCRGDRRPDDGRQLQ